MRNVDDLFEDTESEAGSDTAGSSNDSSLGSILAVNVTTPGLGASTPTATIAESNAVRFADFMNDALGSLDFDELMDMEPDSDDEFVTETGVGLDGLNDLFDRAISGVYSKVVEEKDKVLRSEVTSHTVGPSFEDARQIISHLKDWLQTAGATKTGDVGSLQVQNVTGIMSMYILLRRMNVLSMAKPLLEFTGSDHIIIPVEMSALCVINSQYI
jgi:hypothetical protein